MQFLVHKLSLSGPIPKFKKWRSTQLSMNFHLLIKTLMLKKSDFSCLQTLRCVYYAYKC